MSLNLGAVLGDFWIFLVDPQFLVYVFLFSFWCEGKTGGTCSAWITHMG